MICSNCKNQIVEGAKFCMNCGTPVVVNRVCNGCWTELVPEAKFCPSCGKGRDVVPQHKDNEVVDENNEWYNNEVDESANESYTLYGFGDEHYDRNDFAKAIEFYEKAYRIAPPSNPSGLLFRLGYAYFEVGKWGESIEWYEKFINEFPDHENVKFAYNNLGNSYSNAGDNFKKIECYRKAAQLGNEGTRQWLLDNGYSDPENAQYISINMRGYTEDDLIIKTMRADGVDPETAEDRVWGVYNRRFIYKEGKCMRCGGKLSLLRKCKSCGASPFEGTM